MQNLSIHQILSILPHRYPFLLVDRILHLDDEKVVGLKNVTINEPFFPGHFPQDPVMPGVLILEAMAQTGGCLVARLIPNMQNKLIYFLGIDRARFRQPVRPGDQLIMEVVIKHRRDRTARLEARGKVNEKVVAEAEFLSMVVDRQDGKD